MKILIIILISFLLLSCGTTSVKDTESYEFITGYACPEMFENIEEKDFIEKQIAIKACHEKLKTATIVFPETETETEND
jgi:hypothetical protein